MSKRSAPAPVEPVIEPAINPPAANVDPTPVDNRESFVDAHAASLKASDPETYEAIYGTGSAPAQTAPVETEEEEEEEEVEDPTLATGTPAKGEPVVPLARLNEVLAKVDRLSEALAARDAGQPAPVAPTTPAEPAAPAFDLAAKIRERNAAQWDGNEELAIQIEMEIEAYREAKATEAAVARIRGEDAAVAQRTEFLDVATQLTAEFPALDASNPAANAEAIAAVKAERDVQIKAGQPLAVALKRAVAIVAAEHGLERVAPAATPAPRQTQTQAGGLTPRQVDTARFAAQVANTPPTGVGGRGTGDVAPAQREYTRAEWAALPAAEKNKALGIG